MAGLLRCCRRQQEPDDGRCRLYDADHRAAGVASVPAPGPGRLVAYRSDPQVARYQGWEAPYPADQAHQFLQQLQDSHPDTPGEWFQFAVAPRHTDRLIGDCAAHVRADDPRQAEIGFTLATEHQGHGYATEAVRRLLHYLLIERDKHRVSATCDDRNTRSATVLERVGMRREGHLLESTWSKGEWTNDFLYAVLHREWPTGQ